MLLSFGGVFLGTNACKPVQWEVVPFFVLLCTIINNVLPWWIGLRSKKPSKMIQSQTLESFVTRTEHGKLGSNMS